MTTEPSSFLRKECSCGGSNPSCYKCGGWGYIDKISQGRASPGPAGTPGSSRGRRRAPKNSAVKPTLVKCPQCGAMVGRLAKHLKKVHSFKEGGTPQHAGLVKCPNCSSHVKQSRLKSHIQRVHGTRVPVCSSARSRAGSSELTTGYQADAEQRSFDATRDYARSFRDHGQFGSHPSHDGFDDESTP